MPTKQLLGRLRRLHECQDSAALSDLGPEEVSVRKDIVFKQSPEWQAAYEQLKRVLATRQHTASSAERVAKRKERAQFKPERKSNYRVQ